MTNNTNRISKKEIIIFIVIIIILITIICFLTIKPKNDDSNKVINSNKIQVYSQNTKENVEWNNHDTIIVNPGNIEADLYSFDGGLNWQESNEYIITSNGRVNIIIKDKAGNKTSAVSYTVNTIDNIAPVITVNLPSQIIQNQTIELKDYLQATDDISGIDGEIIINPSKLDTTTLGKKIINCTVKDKAGNQTSINFSIEVVEEVTEDITNSDSQIQPSENYNNDSSNYSDNNSDNQSEKTTPVKYVTLYRYRVKKANSYTCKTYDCSYYSDADTKEKTKTYVETGKCDNSYNKTITFNNGCYIVPNETGASCTQAITKVERYKLYNDNYIDIYALLKDGSQFTTTTSNTNSRTNSELITESTTNKYKKEPCGANEISIYGYCHAICSTPTYTCPTGYQLVDGKCKKYVSKTCSDSCTNYTWSNWSSWSETQVISSDEIQVETKTVKK